MIITGIVPSVAKPCCELRMWTERLRGLKKNAVKVCEGDG